MPAFIKKVFPVTDLHHYANAVDWFDPSKLIKDVNIILLIDFIEFEPFDKQVRMLSNLHSKNFVLLTEHHLPENYFDKYPNIFHLNIPTPETEPLLGTDISYLRDIIDKWRDAGDKLTEDAKQEIINYRRNVVESLPNDSLNSNLFSVLLGNNDIIALDRHKVYAHLEHNNLLKHCNYTIKKVNDFQSSDAQLIEAYNRIKEVILPSPVRSMDSTLYRYDHINNLNAIHSHITSSKIFIGLDNKPMSKGGLLTEKSLYGYLFKRPTIHMGCSSNIKILESLGFRPTKSLTQDISKITNEDEKINALCEEIRFIQAMNNSDFSSWINSMQDDINHNYEMVIQLTVSLLNQWTTTKEKINTLTKSLK